MLLSDRDILSYMEDGLLSITPFKREHLGSNSVDLTLSPTLLVYTDKILDSRKVNPYKYINIPENGLLLLPGELYLGSTIEHTDTPAASKLVPQLEGKSSVARLGVCVHLTAGFGDCGFSGHWTLEITVVKPVIVYPKMPIAQIFYMQMLTESLVPYDEKKNAKYRDQKGPTPSKMWANNF
jgi:dCTP deaminase